MFQDEWKEGRRVINLYYLALQLENGCQKCGKELRLIDTLNEKRRGLGSFLNIRCRRCKRISTIKSDTRHCADNSTKRLVWDVNTKLALGLLHSGFGTAGVNKILSALNIPAVSSELLLSPGTHTKHEAQHSDKKRKDQSKYHETVQYKKRRTELKIAANEEAAVKEVREGLSYQRGFEITPYSNVDLQRIPEPQTEPVLEQLPKGSYEEVIFDLETTGLVPGLNEIVQLAAISGNDRTFNQFVLPTSPMTPGAMKVNRISIKDGDVFQNGHKKDSVSAEECIQKFCTWLKLFNRPVVLIAHNAKFDSSCLIKSCSENMFSELSCVVAGFLDTLKFCRDYYPNMKNYRLETLVKEVLLNSFNAHDALEDSKNLLLLYKHTQHCNNLDFNDTLLYTFSIQSAKLKLEHSLLTSQNLNSLNDMIKKSVITQVMAKKIASSGLNLNALKLAYSRDPQMGIISLFTKKVNGKCRVTKHSNIIDKCLHYLLELQVQK